MGAYLFPLGTTPKGQKSRMWIAAPGTLQERGVCLICQTDPHLHVRRMIVVAYRVAGTRRDRLPQRGQTAISMPEVWEGLDTDHLPIADLIGLAGDLFLVVVEGHDLDR